MAGMTHEWPFLSPFNIWDLRYSEWLGYAASYDQLVQERTKKK